MSVITSQLRALIRKPLQNILLASQALCTSNDEFNSSASLKGKLEYEQGQSPEKGIREYFYFVDHHGQLFLDDARMKNFTSCFKDKQFLHFFFSRLRMNLMERYEDDFPWLSPCGRERNFVRCNDTPVVFTQLIDATAEGGDPLLSLCHSGPLLAVPFEPQRLAMVPRTGRVYHPCDPKWGGAALVADRLAMKFAPHFTFNDDGRPTHIKWSGERMRLRNEDVLEAIEDRE